MVHISSLPHGLLGLIAAAADPNDLANLRLTSKDLCAAATRPFGLSRLAHRRSIVSPYSLQGLIELTAHPVLAPCMKSISLGTYRVNNHHKRHILNAREAADVAASFRVQYNFERDGHSLYALRQALSNLKHRSIRFGLGMHDDLIDDQYSIHHQPGSVWTPGIRGAYGFEQLYGLLDLRHVGRREATGTLLDLCYATKLCGYDLSALSLDFDKALFEKNGGAWQAPVLDPLVIGSVFPDGSTTPVIDFTIKLSGGSIGVDSILRLRSNRSLDVVSHGIEDYPSWTPDICALPYGMFTVALHQKHFDTIVLKDCHADKTLPNVFLPSHSRMLRHFELLDLGFTGHDDDPEGGILDVWKALEDIPNLEVLVLDGFGFTNESRDVQFCGRVILKGAEIRVGLRQLIKKTGEWINSGEERVCFDMPQMVGHES
jgi:hypothetical protein